ncbi:MAG TPA: dipeptide epimerase [Longimicrobiales bacterium]|nr:dipeptide epimerase [Longimicrobiales bacterium]
MRLEHEILELRTRHAFNIARMKGDFVRRTVHVRLIADDGTEGWGEAPVSTPYYGETADTVVAVLPLLQAALTRAFEEARAETLPIEVIETVMNGAIGYNRGAKVAVSAALHDLLGKRIGEPLWRMWGLDPDSAPRSSYTIGIDEPHLMAQRAREAAGFPILKIKIGTPRDEEMLRAIRDAAPDVALKVDANTAWSVQQAIDRLPMLEEFGVELLEQPLHPDDLDGFARLRERSGIPVYADESCLLLADVHRLAGRVDGINIKLAKCGSLLEAQRMIDAAREYGMGVMLGCMLETTLGIAAGVQLAPLVDHLDLDGALLLAEDPIEGPGVEPDGTLRFNQKAGLGVGRRH